METLIDENIIIKIIENYKLKDPARTRIKVFQRSFLFNYLRDHGVTLERIGELFDRNHATVLHGLKTYDDMMTTKNKIYENSVYEIALHLNKEYIFDDPLVDKIHQALLDNDCQKLKEIALQVFKKTVGVDHKKNVDKFIKQNKH